MSKSKGNGIAPDTMADKYGVDTLRIALMFGAPPESDLNFDENFLHSMKQFLDRVAKTGDMINLGQWEQLSSRDKIHDKHKEKLIPIYELLSDYDLKINVHRFFHVAIARLMELNNNLSKLSDEAHLIAYLYLI